MTCVAVAQFAPTTDKDRNLAVIGGLAEHAARRGVRVLVVPEFAMFSAPAMDDRFLDTAETLDGPFVRELGLLAQQHGLALVCGLNERIDDTDRISNTLVAIGDSGNTEATYRKVHLYDAFGYTESTKVRPGTIEAPETFDVDGVTFGLQTCYDLRFPEVTRRIVDAGADVVLLPAAWVPGPLKEHHWTTLIEARAIENTIYLAAAGQTAPGGIGHSMIVDPMGIHLAGIGQEDGVASAIVSRDRIADVRRINPALSLRRFDVAVR